MFTIEDHGNGTATITAVMPDGEGKGTPGLSIWALDEKHPNTNSEVSVISFKLVITNEGEEKGSIKIENKCTGNKSGKFKPIGTQKNTLVKTIKETPKPDKNTATTNFSESESSDCKTYLDKFELWVNKYIVLKKKLNKNPLDIKTAMEISKMAPEIGNWGLEWQEKYVCTQDENFVKRYEEIAQKLDEVN
jgi:hypothetical protein